MESNQKTLRIAHIIGKWVGGGVEAVVMNYYRNINKNEIQFDFICDEDSTNIPYEEINSLGGKVILIPPYQKVFEYQKELKRVLEEGNYKIVHSHINALSVFPLRAAKKAGVTIRIAHSHSTTNKKEWKKNILKTILKPFSKIYATDYFACTEHAARWLFGNKTYENGEVYILNNAIDIKKFEFNKEKREKKRAELGIGKDMLIYGHVGRFVEQKNHKFLIKVFYEIHKKNKNTKLLLIGQGPLELQIREQVKKLGIEDAVLFLGQRNDVNEMYQVFDIFIFPSLYEGLGMVLIEAQCSGCFCVTSNEVPKIAAVTKHIKFIELDDNSEKWCNIIEDIQCSDREKLDLSKLYETYDIFTETKKLENVYYKKYNQYDNIELFGIPACGKSFYANNNLKQYINANEKYIYNENRILRNINKILNVLNILLKHFKLFCKSVALLKKVKLKNKLKMYLYVFSTLNICVISSNKKQKSVLEEGMLQVLWGICYNSNHTEDFICEYIKVFKNYFAKKVIIIDTDIDTIKKRLLEREKTGGSELEHDIKNDIGVIYKAEKIKNDIIKQLQKEKINILFIKEN